MTKFLLLILVIVVVWRLAKGSGGRNAAARGAGRAPEQMVNCAHCGLYLPQNEAIGGDGRYFCCAEHRRLAG